MNGLSHDGFIHRTANVFVDKLRGYLVVFWIDRCLEKPSSRCSPVTLIEKFINDMETQNG